MPDEFYFAGDGLKGLGKDLRGAALSLRLEAPATLERIGKKIQTAAQRIAAGAGSTTIPDTIRGGLNGPLEYRIRAGDESTPIAGLWELGNKGSRPVADTTFTHPVYGHYPPVEQAKHPFLRPALAEDRAAITAEMEAMWDRALGPWRLRPENLGSGHGDPAAGVTESALGEASQPYHHAMLDVRSVNTMRPDLRR